MKILSRLSGIALLLFGLCWPATAQIGPRGGGALVVAVCGTLPLAYKPGAVVTPTQDINGNACIAGTFSATGGTISNATSAQATSGTNQGSVSYNYGFNGTTWDQLSSLTVGSKHALTTALVDGSGNQITSFGATGSTSNASDAVATSSTNVAGVSYNYGFNGTTWDRLQVDASRRLIVGASSGAFATGSLIDLLTFQGTKAAGTAAANSLLAGAVYNSTPLTLTTTQQASLQGDANGYLKVNVAAGGAGGGVAYGPTAAASAAANPPVIIGGTVDGSASGNVDNWKVLSGIGYVNCSNCSGSGVCAVDEAAFSYGSTAYAPIGGFYQTTATSNPLSNGNAGAWQFT